MVLISIVDLISKRLGLLGLNIIGLEPIISIEWAY